MRLIGRNSWKLKWSKFLHVRRKSNKNWRRCQLKWLSSNQSSKFTTQTSKLGAWVRYQSQIDRSSEGTSHLYLKYRGHETLAKTIMIRIKAWPPTIKQQMILCFQVKRVPDATNSAYLIWERVSAKLKASAFRSNRTTS